MEHISGHKVSPMRATWVTIERCLGGRPRCSQTLGLVVAFAVLLALRFSPAMPGLKPDAQTVLGVFLWFIITMVTNALPMAIVGLTAPLLLVLLGHTKIPQAFNAFDTDIFFLAAGAFLIAAVMMGTPLGRRITLTIADLMKSRRVTRMLLGLSLAEVVTHPVIPVVNETALFLPMCKGVTALMGDRGDPAEIRRINTAVMYLIAGVLPLFIGPLILTSHFPNLILAAYLKSTRHITITWLQWFWMNLPLWGLLPIVYFYVVRYFRLKDVEIPGLDAGIEKMKRDLGPITVGEIWALVCLTVGMVFWITGWIKPGMTALLVAGLMFVPVGQIDFEEISRHVLWDILMLLGGAISLGTVLYRSGAVSWMAQGLVNPIQAQHLPLLAVLFVLAFALHIARAGIVSAVASGAAFVPLVAGIATALGYHELPFSLVLINCLSYAFFLPTSITAFLIAWGASKTTAWEAIKFGAPLSVIANVFVLLVQPVWLRMIGLPI